MTTEQPPIVERPLRERLLRTQGSGVLDDGTLVPVYRVNPDGWEAVNTIDELAEALTDWRNSWLCPETNFARDAIPRLLRDTDALLAKVKPSKEEG
jgi:hypothetical protein